MTADEIRKVVSPVMSTQQDIEKALAFLGDVHGYHLTRAKDPNTPDPTLGWAFAKAGYKPATPSFPTISDACAYMLDHLVGQISEEVTQARARLDALDQKWNEARLLLDPFVAKRGSDVLAGCKVGDRVKVIRVPETLRDANIEAGDFGFITNFPGSGADGIDIRLERSGWTVYLPNGAWSVA